MRPGSGALANATVLVLSTSFAVLLVEAMARVVASGPTFGLSVEVRGVASRSVDGVPLWIDSHPRNSADDVQQLANDRGSFTIVGLGDSVLYGDGLSKEETYLEQARHLLQRRTTRPVAVLNLAVKGYNTMQEDAVHKEVADRLTADLVLLHYWADDAVQYHAVGGYVVDYRYVSEADGRLVARALPLPAALSDFLLVHSRLYGLLTQAVLGRREPGFTDWTRVSDPLLRIHERVQRAGGRLLVLASPRLDGEVPQPNDHLPHLLQLGSRHGIEVIDLSDWLAGIPAREIRRDGCHFNQQGHRLLAARFTEYLLEHDLRE